MRDFCKIHNGDTDKPIMYFLHGYDSNKEEFLHFANYFDKKGYTTYVCDARGHGDRKNESDVNDFIGTVKDYDALINDNNKDAILIGISMGGIESLKIGNENAHVKDVFAISAAYDDSEFDDPEYIHFLNETYDNPMTKQDMTKIVPKYYTPNKNTKFFLIHDKNDNVVPIEQFEKNKKHFGLSDDKVLVYDHFIHTDKRTKFFHVYPKLRRKTQKWINGKI